MSVRVSKHAIKRYKQRIAMVTTEAAKTAILAHQAAFDIADKLGGATVRDADGTRYVVKDGFDVTVLGADCRFNHPRKAA